MGVHDTKSHMISKRTVTIIIVSAFFCIALAVLLVSPLFKVRNIKVVGNMYIPTEDVCRIAGAFEGENIFQLHTNKMTEQLNGDLRIEKASVRRVFPSTVEIQVQERVPLARIACEYGYLEIDHEGKVLDAYRSPKNIEVPMVTGIIVRDLYVGDEIQESSVQKVLKYLTYLDPESVKQLVEIHIVLPDRAIAYTAGSVQIRIGTLERLEEKAKLTEGFLAELKIAKHPIEYIDFDFASPFIKFRK
ncbi:MAG: FtsQ-type POTRA domain-containing protein [Selenomonadaceae bacterium]